MPKKSKSKSKHYGLSRQHTRSHARDAVDMDYLAKLSPEESEWLNAFCREYYQMSFTNTDKDFHLAKTDERRALYQTDNERRRDIWNQFERMPLDMTDSANLDEDDK